MTLRSALDQLTELGLIETGQGNNPLTPALRSGPTAVSGATRESKFLAVARRLDWSSTSSPVERTLSVRVAMPASGRWTGERIGPGATYAEASSAVKLEADPTLDLVVAQPPREAVQHLLSRP